MYCLKTFVCFALLATSILVDETAGCGSTRKFLAEEEDTCGQICGLPIKFTLKVENSVIEPKFDFNITLFDEPRRELIHLLEKAAKMDNKFQFSASYHSQFGYFLTSLGGQASGPKGNYSYYWIMYDHPSGESLNLGMSSHVPQHKETILFNLTRYGH